MSATQIESIVERLQRSANVRSVFGDPIERGEKTVVPVARVAFGFGGGYGSGGDAGGEATERTGSDSSAAGDRRAAEPRGGGGGGGAAAAPIGALEITDDGARFVRFGERRRSLALLGAGFAAGVLVGRRLGREE
ncbi:GerW family sporulation protein [Halorussus sp. AFM4]|uniref:GerW family sporulation protein n=1 Tax=Halorussus sp. AFM4 TaxID=3421651 RepID=UPI003EBFB9D1